MRWLIYWSLLAALALATTAYQDPLQDILPGALPGFEQHDTHRGEVTFVSSC